MASDESSHDDASDRVRPAGLRRPRRGRGARVAGRRRARRLRDGHGRRAAHPPLPRAARRSRATAPAAPDAGARRARPGARRSATPASASPPTNGRAAPSTRTGTSCSASFELATACRAGAGTSATSCSSGARDAHGRPAVAVVHRLVAAPAGRLELKPLCTWRDVHGERFAGGEPEVEHGGRRLRVRGRLPGRRPRLQPGGEWYAACATARRRPAGSATARTSGPPARSRASSRRATSSRSTAAAGAPATSSRRPA